MLKSSHLFIFFLLCNTTYIVHAMRDKINHWNDGGDAAREHFERKEQARLKKERQKKHQDSPYKDKHGKANRIDDKRHIQ